MSFVQKSRLGRRATGATRAAGAFVAVAMVAAVLVVGGASPAGADEVEITQEVTCEGADLQTQGLLNIYFADEGGILSLETPMTVDAPESMEFGTTADVTISSQMSIPDHMAEVQQDLGVATTLLNSDVNVVVAGGADALWEGELPPLPPIGEVIVVSNTEQVTATSLEEITFTLQSPFSLSIQIAGGPFSSPIVMSLSCSFSQALLATTTVVAPEGTSVPGAPTGVIAVPGSGQALVGWNAPEDDGGFEITGYVVTAEPGGATVETSAEVTTVDVIGLEAGQYTFTVQARNALGLSEPSTPSGQVMVMGYQNVFKDLLPDDPFFAEIQWLVVSGITHGYDDNTFRAGQTLTRQAMSAFLYRLYGYPQGEDPSCATAPFADVPVDHPFCGEIAWMKAEGVSEGYDGNLYKPDLGLTRQAMSAFLYRLGNPEVSPADCATDPFADVATDHPFCPQIAWMAETGISEGYDGNLYKPDLDLTRQAMAAFLYRFTKVVATPLHAIMPV